VQREAHEESVSLEEVILDLGGKPTVRLVNSSDIILKDASDVTKSDIATVMEHCERFSPSERSGIIGTVHRVGRIKDADGETTIGLTICISPIALPH
jgi:stage III sporulation protein SpoIIIAA